MFQKLIAEGLYFVELKNEEAYKKSMKSCKYQHWVLTLASVSLGHPTIKSVWLFTHKDFLCGM